MMCVDESPANEVTSVAEASSDDGAAGDYLRYVGAPHRRERILTRVRAAGFISISDLVTELGVSDMTIRRDARRLEQDGEIKIVHGGVRLAHATLRTLEFTARAGVNADAKLRIARKAASFIKPRDVLGFDAGTTAFEVVAQLPANFDGTVITHSVPVIQHLLHMPNARVTGLGGDLFPPSQAFVGRVTTAQLANLRMRLFFLGAAAIDEHGLYVEAGLEVNTKNAFINAATQVIAVIDHQKFQHTSPVQLCGLESINILITDRPPEPRISAALKEAKIKTIIAQ